MSTFLAAALVGLVYLGAPMAAVPPDLAGDFLVNDVTTGDQETPAVAVGPDGSLLVVWWASVNMLRGRRFAPDGSPLTEDFGVGDPSVGRQPQLSAAADSAGNAVVVWLGCEGRAFPAGGSPDGQELVLDEPAHECVVVAAGEGQFVLAWRYVLRWTIPLFQEGENYTIKARPFGADGQPVGPSFLVAEAQKVRYYQGGTDGSELGAPAAAVTAAGDIVVVWYKEDYDGGNDLVEGHRYLADGTSLGGFTVDPVVTMPDWPSPAVAASSGRVMVVWDDYSSGSDPDRAIVARAFDESGTPLGSEFQVNTTTAGAQSHPRVAADPGGTFLVAWTSEGSAGGDLDGLSVQGQSLDPDGVPVGGEVQLNSTTRGDQYGPAVAPGAVTWTSSYSPSDPWGTSVRARRWAGSALKDLRAWWRGDGNGDDSSGHGNAGTLVGVGFDWGAYGSAFAFEATAGSHVVAADAPALQVGTGDYSTCFWVRTSASPPWWPAVVDKRGGEPPRGYEVYLANGRVGTGMADASGAANFTANVPEAYVDDGLLHFVCVTVDRDSPDGGHIFVDGRPVLEFDPTPRSGSLDSGEPLTLGRRSDAMGGSDFLDGVVDEVRIWGRALTAVEVSSLFLADANVVFSDGFEQATTDRWSLSEP